MRFGGAVVIVVATTFVACGAAIAGSPLGFVGVEIAGVIVLIAWMRFTRGDTAE